jgi:hypothetical protein
MFMMHMVRFPYQLFNHPKKILNLAGLNRGPPQPKLRLMVGDNKKSKTKNKFQ